jgi:hypothetical protein
LLDQYEELWRGRVDRMSALINEHAEEQHFSDQHTQEEPRP